MIISLNNKIRSGYLIAFLLLLTSYILIFYTIRKLTSETNSVSHTYTVINKLERLKSQVFDAETGLRGYVITQDPRFLQPYTKSIDTIPGLMGELKTLILDNRVQSDHVSILEKLVERKMAFMSSGLANYQKNNLSITEEMKLDRETSKRTTDSIRLVISNLQNNEEALMEKRKTQLSRFFAGVNLITIISLAIAILAIVYSWITYGSENKAKILADRKTAQYREELELNIKELKQANTELEELRSLEKFAATGRIARTIAHEVRNPLTNISLATDQLNTIIQADGDSSLLLQMISRNASRINQLVSDLLNATRFGQLEFVDSDINHLVDETLQLAKDRMELKQVRLEKHYSPELCKVVVDPEKIKLALLNIVVNAIEAMDKGQGVLKVYTQRKDGKCLIEIRDNGIGMDEDTLQKLFDPYFTAKKNGNGLGLTNTQNIILNHRGNLKVASKPGFGTSFTLILNLSNSVEKV